MLDRNHGEYRDAGEKNSNCYFSGTTQKKWRVGGFEEQSEIIRVAWRFIFRELDCFRGSNTREAIDTICLSDVLEARRLHAYLHTSLRRRSKLIPLTKTVSWKTALKKTLPAA
jgi:hypothetical protein